MLRAYDSVKLSCHIMISPNLLNYMNLPPWINVHLQCGCITVVMSDWHTQQRVYYALCTPTTHAYLTFIYSNCWLRPICWYGMIPPTQHSTYTCTCSDCLQHISIEREGRGLNLNLYDRRKLSWIDKRVSLETLAHSHVISLSANATQMYMHDIV